MTPPPPAKPPKSNPTRVRDNQRRSRARQKEYIRDLESKLQTYERQGVQASLEIQAAARSVLDENRRLRALLLLPLRSSSSSVPMMMTTMMTTTEEQVMLKSEVVDDGESSVRGSETGKLRAMLEKSGSSCSSTSSGTGKCCGAVAATAAQAQAKPADENISPPPPSSAACIKTDPSSSPRSPPKCSSLPPPAAAVPGLFPEPDPTSPTTKPVPDASHPSLGQGCNNNNSGTASTSCALAVSIITGMRADVSADEVQVALGCGLDGVRECEVENSRLFSTLDQYAE